MDNKAQKWMLAANKDATVTFPFPINILESDNAR